MRLPRASLIRRLTAGFVVGHTVGLSLFLLAMLPLSRNDNVDQMGTGVVVSMLHEDLIETEQGLELRPNSSFAKFAPNAPDVWFVARNGEHVLSYGNVPHDASSALAALPPLTQFAEFGNIGASGRVGDMAVSRKDLDPTSLLVAAGGVPPMAVGWSQWLAYLNDELYTLFPLGTALFTLLGAMIAIPLVLRSVRPTVQAALALDPSIPSQRLPEQGVVKELLPMVLAFNGALERLEASFERRRRFIADVAHELRTPLALLNIHIEVLPESRGKADLQRTVFRMGHMVGQMLDAERLALASRQHQSVDLVTLSKSAVADIAPLALAGGYDLTFTSEAETTFVHADPHAVMRAVLNLLGNAIAHGGNSGCIEVHVLKQGCIDVADEGPGVPVEARERIFEPFRRERWDRDGCGLGLHLVKEIMLSHSGDVQLLSGGNGSVFRLDFRSRSG